MEGVAKRVKTLMWVNIGVGVALLLVPSSMGVQLGMFWFGLFDLLLAGLLYLVYSRLSFQYAATYIWLAMLKEVSYLNMFGSDLQDGTDVFGDNRVATVFVLLLLSCLFYLFAIYRVFWAYRQLKHHLKTHPQQQSQSLLPQQQ